MSKVTYSWRILFFAVMAFLFSLMFISVDSDRSSIVAGVASVTSILMVGLLLIAYEIKVLQEIIERNK